MPCLLGNEHSREKYGWLGFLKFAHTLVLWSLYCFHQSIFEYCYWRLPASLKAPMWMGASCLDLHVFNRLPSSCLLLSAETVYVYLFFIFLFKAHFSRGAVVWLSFPRAPFFCFQFYFLLSICKRRCIFSKRLFTIVKWHSVCLSILLVFNKTPGMVVVGGGSTGAFEGGSLGFGNQWDKKKTKQKQKNILCLTW